MKKLLSVSVILSVCTGLLVLMLVTLFAAAGRQHYDNREQALTRLSVATIAQQFVLADESLRDERGVMGAVRRPGTPAGVADMVQLAAMHARSNAALAAVAALLKTERGAAALADRQGLAQAQIRYEAATSGMMAVLRLPANARPEATVAEWSQAANALVDALQSEIVVLSQQLSGIDSFVDEMMKAGNIAMAVRYQAGTDRAALADAISAARPLAEKDRIQFAELKVGIASPWSVIQGSAKNPAFPAPLRQAVAETQRVYFTDQEADRQALIAQLNKGQEARAFTPAGLDPAHQPRPHQHHQCLAHRLRSGQDPHKGAGRQGAA